MKYPTPEAKAIFILSFQVLDSTIYPTKGKPKNGPINAQNIIDTLLSATVAIYIVDAVSKMNAARPIIKYFFINWKEVFL